MINQKKAARFRAAFFLLTDCIRTLPDTLPDTLGHSQTAVQKHLENQVLNSYN